MFPTLQPQNIAVFDIAVAQAGTRYVFCGSSKGLYYMDSSQQWKLLLPTLEYGEIIHIVDIPEKELLFCVTSQRKLFGVLYEDLRIIPYASFPYGPIKQLHYSPQQGLIILSDTGIYSSDVSSSDPSILTMSPMYIDENIDMLYSNNQKIWITKEDQLLFSDPYEIEWNTTNLPISTRVLSIQYSPTNALTFILSSTQGIFYSYDLQKWVAPETSIQDCNVTSIVQDVVIPTTLYCATLNHGVYQSIDHGITWSTMNEGIEFKSIDCLLSIHEPFHTLYAGTLQDGLYSAYYPDHQWSIQNAVFEKGTITALSPSNNDEQPMLVGIWDPATEQSLLYYSFNSGLQWYPVIFPSRITSIQGFDSNPSMFWIGTNHGLYLWDANTLSYEPTIFTKSITVIQKDDWDEKNLFIGTLQGLYKTNNKGETFQEMSCNYQYNLGKIDDFSFHVVEPHTIMVVSAGQIFQSINKGETWKPIPLPIEYFVTVIYHDAVDPNTLYAGTKDHGVIYTIDSGNHWKISNNFGNP
ncbi:MAG: hypothetical protein PHX86_02305 [Caldisericia bacterium]|nr:hypothetical protein [Caldisericia bacterium]